MTLRRPLTPGEAEHLRALGDAFATLCRHAGVSVRHVAAVSRYERRYVERIRQGTRRTRRSTLTALVEVMVKACPGLGDRDELVAQLVAVAGPALAPESPYAAKTAARRNGKVERVEARRAMYAHLMRG